MITVHNRTDERISTTIDAHLFNIPPKGSVQTSEKKAEALVKAYPKKLGYAPPSLYSKKDIAAVKKLTKEQLLDCCMRLMEGESVSPQKMLAAKEAEKTESGENEQSQ